MLLAQILAHGLLVPYMREPDFTQSSVHFREREELKLNKRILLSGFVCLAGLMKVLTGETDKVSLVYTAVLIQ